ncbi:MAG: hypothetical protein WAN97_04505 [Candidatus Acidiferrales bacterium]
MASVARVVRIAEYHNDVVSSLRLYFDLPSQDFTARYYDKTIAELESLLAARLEETDLRSALTILADLEAAFRYDYEYRCLKRLKDPISRAFRAIEKSRKKRIGFDEDILEAWKHRSPNLGRIVGEFRAARNFRHWLAHGRSGEPKLGRKYDFSVVYALAEAVLKAFPLHEPSN